MPEATRFKRQLKIDGIVIFGIILGIVALTAWSSRNLAGWDIKGREESLEGEERQVDSNVYIRSGAVLSLTDSQITIDSTSDNQFGVFVNGDSSLKMEDSDVESTGYRFFVIGSTDSGKSPEIVMESSRLRGLSSLYLRDRTKLEMRDSEVYELHMQDDAHASLTRTAVIPVLYAQGSQAYTGLKSGQSITLAIESNSGWRLDMEECKVDAVKIALLPDDSVTLADSGSIVLFLVTPGNLRDEAVIDLSEVEGITAGKIEGLGSEVTWGATVIDAVGISVTGTDVVSISNGLVEDVMADDESAVTLSALRIWCPGCMVSGDAAVVFDGITVEARENQRVMMRIEDTANVTFRNSDIRGMKIEVRDTAVLRIENSQYDTGLIDVSDTAVLEVTGEEENI